MSGGIIEEFHLQSNPYTTQTEKRMDWVQKVSTWCRIESYCHIQYSVILLPLTNAI